MQTQTPPEPWLKPGPRTSRTNVEQVYILEPEAAGNTPGNVSLDDVHQDIRHFYFTVGRHKYKDGGRYGALCTEHPIEVRADSQLQCLLAIFTKVHSLNCNCPEKAARPQEPGENS